MGNLNDRVVWDGFKQNHCLELTHRQLQKEYFYAMEGKSRICSANQGFGHGHG